MIPAIPSDNLYKAATFSGATLFVVSLIGPAFIIDRFNAAQTTLLKDLNDSNVKLYLAMPPKTDKTEDGTA